MPNDSDDKTSETLLLTRDFLKKRRGKEKQPSAPAQPIIIDAKSEKSQKANHPADPLPWLIHMVTAGEPKGWVHTHGLAALGLPELEFRDVPMLFLMHAANMLDQIGDYMRRESTTVKAGERMELGYTLLAFAELPPYEGFEDHAIAQRLTVVEYPARKCDGCGGMHQPYDDWDNHEALKAAARDHS